jgi:trigger factor
MNISKEIKDDLTAVITLNIAEEDYKPQVEQELKKYRANAAVKGFRKGKAPLGLIKRMAGNSITVQEIDKLVSQSVSDYLAKEEMNILGQPLPVKDQEPLDLDNKTEFNFSFEVGESPEVEVSFEEDIQIPYYIIKVDDDIIKEETDRIRNQYGKLEQVDEVNEKSYLKVDIAQSDEEGNIIEEGISNENTTMAVDLIKDEEIKKQFIGKKAGDTVSFDIKKAYPNDSEISGLLNIEKEKVAEIEPYFNVSINEVTDFAPAEMNTELFDKAFGEGEVKTEEEFKEKIKQNIAEIYKKESDFRFSVDAKEKLIERYDPQLPDNFLKRWLLETDKNGELTEEKLEEEYPKFAEDLKWRVINKNIAEEQKFEVSAEELTEEARNFALMQLQQYGIDPSQMPPDTLIQFAEKNMEKPEDRERFAEKVIENKVVDFVKENVKLNEKEIDREEFKKLYE